MELVLIFGIAYGIGAAWLGLCVFLTAAKNDDWPTLLEWAAMLVFWPMVVMSSVAAYYHARK